MTDEACGGGSPARRLSQMFEPLARLSALHQELPLSTPSSPRLLGRRGLEPTGMGAGLTGGSQGVNWQERCLELQLELHRSRNQATRVRDMLRDKRIL